MDEHGRPGKKPAVHFQDDASKVNLSSPVLTERLERVEIPSSERASAKQIALNTATDANAPNNAIVPNNAKLHLTSGTLHVWVTDDKYDIIGSALYQLLPRSTKVTHWSLLNHTQGFHQERLRQGLEQDIPPVLTMIHPPGCHQGVNHKQQFKLNGALHLAKHQVKRGAHFTLELPGPPKKSMSSQYLVEQAAKDLPPECAEVVKIKLCNLGINTGNGPDSRMTDRNIYLISNLNLPRHWNQCLCGRSVADHADTQHTYLKERIRDNALQVLVPVILSHLVNAQKPENKFQFAIPIVKYLRDLPIGTKERICPEVLNSLGLATAAKPTRYPEILPERPPTQEPEPTYPTESRMRQKAKERELKAAGKEVVKKTKPKVIEPGTDDCGEDHTPIMFIDSLLEMFYDQGLKSPEAFSEMELPDDIDLENFLMNMEGQMNPLSWLYGSELEHLPKTTASKNYYKHMSHFQQHCHADRDDSEFVDVMELCGGTARVSYLLIRRWHRKPYRVGKNFDAVVGCDLLDSTQRKLYSNYLTRTQPLVVIISTPCKGLKGWKHLNAIRAPEALARARAVSLALGQLGGETALHQLRHNRHFLGENPRGSDLWQIRSWRQARQDSRVVWDIIDMCEADLKIDNKFVKKESEIVASDEALLAPLRPLKCNKQHEHIQLAGTWKGVPKTQLAQIWPWDFASRVASGVAAVVRKYYEDLNKEHYPTAEEVPPPGQRSRSNRLHWPCPACRTNMAKDHPRHNRHPDDCRYPYDEAVPWGCAGCKFNLNRGHNSHTLKVGECRWASADYRATARRGRHPRDPRIPASSDPTSSLRAQPN